MTSKTFRKHLVNIIEDSDGFATDTIDMKGITTPMDEVICVVGVDDGEIFLIHIQKI